MFFKVISVKEFYNLFSFFEPVKEILDVEVFNALNRVVAMDIHAREDFPPFMRACMDGYAVRAEDTFGGGESNPIYLRLKGEVEIDKIPDFSLGVGECAKVVTGSPIPEGADAVVMVEYTEAISKDEIEIRCSVSPGENLILQGEDYKRGDSLIFKGTLIRPQEIGILLEFGITRCKVFRPLKVGIISTGNEIVPPSTSPLPMGKIRDVNSYTIGAIGKKINCEPYFYEIVPDDSKILRKVIQKGIDECDIVLISGGSSIGAKDLTEETISSFENSEILCHGVGISPGKPTLLAKIGKIPVIGLPGQVTSAQVVMFILIVPFLRYLSNDRQYLSQRYFPITYAYLTENVPSKRGREEYVRVRLIQDKDKLFAEPIFSKSGLIKSLVKAQGLLKIPSSSEGILKGSFVQILLI